MIKKILFVVVSLFVLSGGYAQGKHVFSLGKKDFLLDGKPFQIISGEMHPGRIPKEYWRHRIQMTKAMGCNTIAAYVFWNYHETTPGKFDFTSENRNIGDFLKICEEEKMWVLLRPGPYVCAEWDFGGLPSYLLKTPDIKLRCMDSTYLTAVKRYVNKLSVIVKSHLVTNGGNILMVQIENEYGSFGNDREYLKTLHTYWTSNGINTPFYTADGATTYMLEAGSLPGLAVGLDSGSDPNDFKLAYKTNPGVPVFSSETYPGWLTHWGEKWARPDTTGLLKEIKFLLDSSHSFNFYVIHGGTNFGFTAGANAFSATQYQPDITSYDYDAPINEQGRATPKYYALRNLITKYVKDVPAIPAPIPAMNIPEITMQAYSSVWSNLPKPVKAAQPKPFEYYGQNQGMMVYKTKLIGHKSGKLTITEPHDYALVFLNGKFIDTIFRSGGHWTVDLPKTDVKEPELEILVEGMGHINFAQFMIDRKGITDRVTLNGMTLMNWEIYPLPFADKYVDQVKPAAIDADRRGTFFQGTFNLQQTADTYIDMSQYKKGIVWVNGHNLGRYWYVGPQQRLYCPASWLKKGTNKIVVFDLLENQAQHISGKETME
ncbi:beta-galactosidase [Pinibacter aurantiacus]|uniref:Beta-galactosidase n=1 Tax=Pinibacter aurantiacus TaxID=2851599 RepID=A0A9E2W572_9BACT|nr:beta-galactosidase [Pinibacter aurantiacus]MBV4360555.1 beta-galactosidase [Pinibacter aurantiacus]